MRGRDAATHEPVARRGAVLAAAVAIGAAWLGIASTAAQASVVSMTRSDIPAMSSNIPKAPDFVPAYTLYVLSIVAATGEANAIAVERDADAFSVRDLARPAAGTGCVAVDPITVRCPTPRGPAAAFVRQFVGGVELGDGNDRFQGPAGVHSSSEQATVDAGPGADAVTGAANAIGGPGDDRLVAVSADGGPGDDRIHATQADGGDGRDVLSPLVADIGARLSGGGGDDVLTGGAGADTLDGGDGADRLEGAAGDDALAPGPGADAIDGGGGSDSASFSYATAAVRADLAAAGPADPTGEGDALRGVESLEGGAGDDELRGDGGVNRLLGGGGRDHLDGRGGRDHLDGGESGDLLAGGDGDDVVVGAAGADRLAGGAGADDLAADVAVADPDDGGFLSSDADGAGDTVRGDAGHDVLQVSRGDDADAGAGDDLLIASGRPRALACGPGAHDVIDAAVLVPRDCERIRVLAFGDSISTRLLLRATSVYVRVPSFLGPEEPTRVVIVLRAGRRVLGRGRRVVPDGASRVVRIAIGRVGRRALRASGSVRLHLVAADSTSTERDTVVLRAPR